MRAEELDFELPTELIAQQPPERRGDSRLLHYARASETISHRQFTELPSILRAGDLLVFNDTRVIPARFELVKATGGRVEGLFVDEEGAGKWSALLRNLGAARELTFADDPSIRASVTHVGEGGLCRLRLNVADRAGEILDRLGRMPLPPYIRRDKRHDPRDAADRQRYQTVYAREGHSVAAPTAGLHFTPELLAALDAAGIQRVSVSLDVGLGTFKPVGGRDLAEHSMHRESYRIPTATADALNKAKAAGRRIIAVGTTSARVLESQPPDEPFVAREDSTAIFIYPPYRRRHVDALITNFHLPRSTLIALVAAMVGLMQQRRIYAQAIEQRYRFFSFGDAMFIDD